MATPTAATTALRRTWLLATVAVILAGIIARFLINFSHAYPPGTDAGYYPMQVRFYLTHGRLMYDDLPLVFWLDASVAKVLATLGWPLDSSAMMASRIIDCLAAPIVAAPIMAIGYRWAERRWRALPGCVGSALLAVLSPPVIRSMGFHKTSFGLMWMAAAVWACVVVMDRPGARTGSILLAILGLCAITHVGAFAVTCLTVLASFGIWTLKRQRITWRAAAYASVAGAVSISLLGYLEPGRAVVLATAPVRFLGVSGFRDLDTFGRLLALIALAVAVFGLRRVWRDRGQLAASQVSVAASAAVILLLLVLPKNAAVFYRLLLMTPVPGAIVLTFIVARRAMTQQTMSFSYLLLAGSLTCALASPLAAIPPVLDEPAARELREIPIANPDTTLVIAPHGLEWFVGYLLDTPVRGTGFALRRDAVPADAFSRYRRVLFIRFRARRDLPLASAVGSGVTRIHSGPRFEVFELAPPS